MKPRRFEQHRSKSSMMCNRFSDFNVKSDKGKTPLIVLRCADNRQLFEGTGKGNGKAMKYAIYEGNIDRLEKKLKRISNKCKAYGCDFHYEQTGEEFRELKDEKGNKYTARFVLVEAEGTAIINDWEFIAELEHTENGNIITGVAGVEVPERYYTTRPMCEHCNSKRFRKNTYIVRNKKTGEFKQVGKSCLKDFTHGMSAEAVTQYMSLFDTLIEGETPEPGCAFQRYVSTKEYLLYVAETIRHFGYTRSSDEGISTASQAIDFYDAAHGRAVTKEYLQDLIDKMESVNFDIDNQSSVELVSNALVWVSEQEENNNYIHNLKTACSLEYVKGNFGLYASLFPAYDRDLERTAKRKAVQSVEQSSEFVGEISDRITVKIQSVKCVTSWETDFGITRIYKLIGAADDYAAKASEAAGNKEDYQSISDAFNEGFTTFDAFQDGWASDAFNAGAAWGDGIADKVSNFSLSDVFGQTDIPNVGDYTSGFNDAIANSGVGDSIGNIDDNTGKIKDSLDVTEEDLKYLRDIAEQEAINRFTTAEINVDMSGMQNTVNSGDDIDGFMTKLTDSVNEAVDNMTEGVHE